MRAYTDKNIIQLSYVWVRRVFIIIIIAQKSTFAMVFWSFLKHDRLGRYELFRKSRVSIPWKLTSYELGWNLFGWTVVISIGFHSRVDIYSPAGRVKLSHPYWAALSVWHDRLNTHTQLHQLVFYTIFNITKYIPAVDSPARSSWNRVIPPV